MHTLRHRQTIAPDLGGLFRLPVSIAGRDIKVILTTMNVNAIVLYIQNDYYGNVYVTFGFYDTSNAFLGITTVPMAISDIVTNGVNATVSAAIAAAAMTNSYTVLSISWSVAENMGPKSYQTLISQTGTSAPTSSITPTSTYPTGTTFTWARTGAGVYTLTASAAVFSTTKTGVFVEPLTNLNAGVKAVVTSTTVITVTTAVQSVAVLGLLGLTTTNTDALLSNTMLYVQTYA